MFRRLRSWVLGISKFPKSVNLDKKALIDFAFQRLTRLRTSTTRHLVVHRWMASGVSSAIVHVHLLGRYWTMSCGWTQLGAPG